MRVHTSAYGFNPAIFFFILLCAFFFSLYFSLLYAVIVASRAHGINNNRIFFLLLCIILARFLFWNSWLEFWIEIIGSGRQKHAPFLNDEKYYFNITLIAYQDLYFAIVVVLLKIFNIKIFEVFFPRHLCECLDPQIPWWFIAKSATHFRFKLQFLIYVALKFISEKSNTNKTAVFVYEEESRQKTNYFSTHQASTNAHANICEWKCT